MMIGYEWDEGKRLVNLELHKLDFQNVDEFDWESTLVSLDTRREYGEDRYIAYGKYKERLTVLVFAVRENTMRIISWRKANDREQKIYGTRIQSRPK
jgi:uncharacterized DUF497 family protein